MDRRLTGRRSALGILVTSLVLLTAASAAMADIERMEVHGFASQGYMGSTGYNYLAPSLDGSWALSEYALNVRAAVNDDLRVGIQLFGRSLGDLGQNNANVDWAFGDYHPSTVLAVRAGRVKMPYGLYNETADFDAVRTSVLMPQGVYDLRMRDFRMAVNGVSPYGCIDLGSAGDVEYAAVYGFVNHDSQGSVAKFLEDAGFGYRDMNNEHTAVGQLVWNTPLQGLRLGHTIANYKSSVTLEMDAMSAAFLGVDPLQDFHADNINVNTTSAEFTYGVWSVAGEYNTWTGEFKNPYFGFELNWENWYGQGSYRLNPWFEVGSYYSVHYEDKNDRGGKGYDPNFSAWQKDLALSLRFDVSPNMIFKLEGHRMDGYASIFAQDNMATLANPDALDQNWYMVISKVSFVF